MFTTTLDYALLALSAATSLPPLAALYKTRTTSVLHTAPAMVVALQVPVLLGAGFGKPRTYLDPAAWYNQCGPIAVARIMSSGVISAAILARLTLAYLASLRRASRPPYVYFCAWLSPWLLTAVGTSNEAFYHWNGYTCSPRGYETNPHPLWIGLRGVGVFVLPVLATTLLLLRLRGDGHGRRRLWACFALELAAYAALIGCNAVGPAWVATMWRLFHLQTLVLFSGVFWMFMAPELRRAEPPPTPHTHAPHTPRKATAPTLIDAQTDSASVELLVDGINEPGVEALQPARPYHSGVLDRYVAEGQLLHALMELLATATGTLAFETFLAHEQADESIKFLRAVHLYGRLVAPPVDHFCSAAADDVHRRFLADDAPSLVPLHTAQRDPVRQAIEAGRTTPRLFADVRYATLRLLTTSGAFARFLESPEYERARRELAEFRQKARKLMETKDAEASKRHLLPCAFTSCKPLLPCIFTSGVFESLGAPPSE